MDPIRAALCDRIHGRSGVLAVLSSQRTSLDFEFLERIGEWKGEIEIVERIVMCATVEQVGHTVGQATAHRESHSRIFLVGVEISGWGCIRSPARRISCVAWRPLSGNP